MAKVKSRVSKQRMAGLGKELQGPHLLRVVRCLPSRAGVPGRDRACRAGVTQASREETAGGADAVREDYRAMGI